MTIVLSVNQLQKVYEGKVPYQALKDINFKLKKGEFVAIMGPSGSGKSTLLQVISTIDSPTGGSVLIDGKNPHQMVKEELASFRRRELGFIFQDFNLIHTLTVEENIMLPLSLEGVPANEITKRTREVARYLGIEALLPKRTFEISGGQAQRVAIARAVAHQPSLILADEPTGNLDSKATKDVMNLLKTLNKEMDSTILMVTHDAYVASMCHRVLFIKDGRIYQEIVAGDHESEFYQRILDMLTFLGGDHGDVNANRL
ncbi:MAG: ABC transporter ATP-binding protein [Turicibacter sp.]|jgi:putative ABC transport system ATP-binding protein|uniref:ABC transporter ATP-binding protein n=1 Tax=Turicibacter faecis TaxID=2963365 RepID=A0ABN6ZCX2_9FIRM|nr:ABC transporter ATP-binding protein [Turicibacter sp. TS3]MCI8701956.1 ABC transporter ATP-binding protein [Turicibacter sp.]MCI9351251.1 ABC transporter ATP-binding protein [Turicibacter sp.]NCE77956.1 ABC transporter ATP-binding protein [Turicibacter sp. TS3]BEH90904.1 ABC transporter ATP-binding protein [Turicibacter sp. TC023]